MSTLSTEEASWIENQVRHSTAASAWDLLTEQTRMTLAEVGLGGDVHWEWPDQCAAWTSFKKE